jgi:hypothetical protein
MRTRVAIMSWLDSRIGRLLLALGRVAFWSGAAVLAFALCRRGLALDDEGAMLSSAAAVLDGKVPYRDLDMFVTPAAWYLNAAVFAVAGKSILATRIAAGLCLLATMAVARRIVRVSTGHAIWADFAAASIAVFAVWAWPTWTWSFYSPYATLFALIALAFTVDWMGSRRRLALIACGIAIGLAIAFKQNYGVFAGVGCAMAIFLDEITVAAAGERMLRDVIPRFTRDLLFVALGGVAIAAPALLWLYSQGALGAAFELLAQRPFSQHTIRYLQIGDMWRQLQAWTMGGLIYLAVPMVATSASLRWPPALISLVVVLHVVLYWAPVFALSAFGFRGLVRIRSWPPLRERMLLGVVVFAAVYFAGVLPKADFNHLINVYQPTLVALVCGGAWCFGEGRWRSSVLRRALAGFAAILCFCFAGMSAVWMNDLRKTLWFPLDAPRARGLLVDPLDSQVLNDEIALLRTLTVDDEPVIALPYLSMVPFLAERPMPTRYRNYYAVHIGHDSGEKAAQEIERSDARVVVTSYDNFFSDPTGMLTFAPVLTDYLRTNFRPAFAVGNQAQIIWLRRKSPRPSSPARDLWTMCNVASSGFPQMYVKERLLFQSVFQSFRGAWADTNQALTSCQFTVPTNARLKVALELRQPMPVETGGTARAELWLFKRRGRPVRLFAHEWPLVTEIPSIREFGKEFDIDLTRWSDQTVGIALRTLIEGQLPDTSFDPFGVSVVWNDARLESPDYAETDATAEHLEAGVETHPTIE